MGRATRWLRGLLGGKKSPPRDKQYGSVGVEEVKREKKRWSFGKSGRSAGEGASRIKATTPEEAAWLHSLYAESEKEQSRRAIAVAAATAAAADAAVAAAHAAVAVVRLTSKGRSAMFSIHERLAAVKIQTFFRAYLAKKALRALKALVKLQALVRGYLVRKHVAASLRRMQSLVRAQATIREHRSHRRSCPRQSLERFDDCASSPFHSRRLSVESSSFDRSPRIVEIDTYRPKSRSSRRTAGEDLPPPPLPARITAAPGSAQSTPRWVGYDGPPTPAKSVGAAAVAEGSFRRFWASPGRSYMASTQSFEAKLRAQSPPRQRPEFPAARKRVPLSEVVVGSRPSVGMERSEASISFRRMDGSLELQPCTADSVYLHSK